MYGWIRRKCFAARAVPVALAALGVVLAFPLGAAAERVTDGLVALWKFEETSGDVLKDETGTHDATIVNGPELDVEGKIGSALRIPPGTGPRMPMIEAPAHPDFDITGSLTIEFWLRPPADWDELAGGDTPQLVSRGDESWQVRHETNGRLRFTLRNRDGATDAKGRPGLNVTVTTAANSVRAEEWTHVAAVLDVSAPCAQIYLNGVLNARSTASALSHGAGLPGEGLNDTVQIGFQRDGDGNPRRWMQGAALDEVAIYDRALSAAEIRQNMGIVPDLVAELPYPPSPVIAGMDLDWSTHERHAQGSDNFQLAWADDDHQYGAYGDGGGFGGTNSDGRVGLGFSRIEGDGDDYQGFNVWGGKDAENPATFAGKSWGTISVKGVLYSWIVPDTPDTGGPRDHYRYIELARSTDRGATWTKADWRWRLEDNLIVPTFLVFGKDNAGARDEYVYCYFIRPQRTDITQGSFGLEVHKPGALFLARVHQDRIFESRDAYEWFTGMEPRPLGVGPTWGPLEAKTPVFANPDGTGWCVSASYNPGLRRYLLATEHTASHSSVMALFDAPEPWGPWTTVAYWTPEETFGKQRPGSDLDWAENIFFFSFAPKWWSDGGRSFTLVFTGGGRGRDNDSFNTIRGTFRLRGAPYPQSTLLGGVAFDWSTHLRQAIGSDIWPITWADDDHQYTSWGDGGGFEGSNHDGRVSMGVARVEGDGDDYRGVNVWGGKDAENPATFTGKGTGILCVDGVLYMWVSRPASLTVPETHLAVSKDHSRTWRLSGWNWTMQDLLFAGTFLNFGRNYAEARDDYVYAYFSRLAEVPDAPRNWIHEVPGRVDLARVPKDSILDQGAYEWFAGLGDQGEARWTPDIAARRKVFEDPGGIKIVSAVFQPRLQRYLLVYNPRDNRGNFGLFEAAEPWGPWRTVSYLEGYEPFMPPSENTRVSVFHFPPKWWSDDGREFTLLFNTGDDAWNTVRGRMLDP